MFQIVDHISDPGHPGKPNEDCLAFTSHAAAVVDGATGLWDRQIIPGQPSDAAWLAVQAATLLTDAEPEESVRDIVHRIAMQAREAVVAHVSLDLLPRYAWPGAGFIMARQQAGMIEISGLGDCVALVEFDDGAVEVFCPMPEARLGEAQSATRDLAALVSGGEALRSPSILESVRRRRSMANTEEGGIWTLGLEPAAAEHVMTMAIPSGSVASVLLASDGFSCLSDTYERYSPQKLVEQARLAGLPSLVAEIRRIERIEDPACRRFARYKQSDDATAILLRARD